jgi:hypothetical protein
MIVGGRIILADPRLTLCIVLLIQRFFIAGRIIGSVKTRIKIKIQINLKKND